MCAVQGGCPVRRPSWRARPTLEASCSPRGFVEKSKGRFVERGSCGYFPQRLHSWPLLGSRAVPSSDWECQHLCPTSTPFFAGRQEFGISPEGWDLVKYTPMQVEVEDRTSSRIFSAAHKLCILADCLLQFLKHR